MTITQRRAQASDATRAEAMNVWRSVFRTMLPGRTTREAAEHADRLELLFWALRDVEVRRSGGGAK